MTEKRFVMPDGDLDTDVTLIDTLTGKEYEDNFNDIVDLLNELNDENQELQGKYDAQKQLFCQLNSDKNNIWQDYQDLKKENEQLKQFQDRVFSWIDMHLQRLPTLIDDEFNSDNEFADPSLYSGALQILETMKKELKGDVE